MPFLFSNIYSHQLISTRTQHHVKWTSELDLVKDIGAIEVFKTTRINWEVITKKWNVYAYHVKCIERSSKCMAILVKVTYIVLFEYYRCGTK